MEGDGMIIDQATTNSANVLFEPEIYANSSIDDDHTTIMQDTTVNASITTQNTLDPSLFLANRM